MAHKHIRRHRHNPLGLSGGVVKDVALNAAGLVGSYWGSSFLGQSGWLDVLATGAVSVGIFYLGKSVAGEPASEELLKGGLLATLTKAIKQTGVSLPGLGLYVPSYFSAPTSSDAYGRATAPTIMLPAPPATAAGGKGVHGMGVARYRSRFQTRF